MTQFNRLSRSSKDTFSCLKQGKPFSLGIWVKNPSTCEIKPLTVDPHYGITKVTYLCSKLIDGPFFINSFCQTMQVNHISKTCYLNSRSWENSRHINTWYNFSLALQNQVRKSSLINCLHHNISIHILHIVLSTHVKVLTRIISWKSRVYFVIVTLMCDSGVILWGEIRCLVTNFCWVKAGKL